MTPLLFIILVTAVLVLMVYWILSNPAKRHHQETTPQRKYDFETAGELFKYVEPVREIDENELKLSVHSKYILASWNIKASAWKEILHEFGHNLDYEDLLIRLYDSRLQSNNFELPVSDLTGTCHFQSVSGTAYYAVIGLKQADDFIPLFLSNTVNTAGDPKDVPV